MSRIKEAPGDKVKRISGFTLGCFIILFVLNSCSRGPVRGEELQQESAVTLSCIAVLPATASADRDITLDYSKAQNLEKGAGYATEVLTKLLRGDSRARLLTFTQVSSFVPELTGDRRSMITAIGENSGCNGVLQTVVRRYRQREGTNYAVDVPAFVDLSLILRHADSGRILWSADVTEEQQSLLNNLFSFKKAQKRGFRWVSVEQLMEQGIETKLAQCPYLQ